MEKKISFKNFSASIENASILRRFTIFFLLMSLIPVAILYYFYLEINKKGTIEISPMDFNLTLMFVVLGVIVGYFSMREILMQLINLTNANQRALRQVLSPEKIRDLSKEKDEIAVLAQSFSTITSELEESVRNLEIAKKTLHSIMDKVSQGISNMENIDTFLELILETVTEAMQGKIGIFFFYDKGQNQLWVKMVYGALYDETQVIRWPLVKGSVFDEVIVMKKVVVLDYLNIEDEQLAKHKNLFIVPMVCAPLICKDKVLGLLVVSGRKKGNFDEGEHNLINNLASQTAVAIENSRLNRDKERTYFETISALALAVDAKDKYSWGHLDRVANLAVEIGKKIGLEEKEIKILRDAAKLHDLGKIGIPDEVLGKKGPLTDQDRDLMRKHPEIGESIIKPIHSLEPLCDIIRHHHEKLDGSGYPDGLAGDQISPLVRILTIVDIYDALITDRPYRPRFSIPKACAILRDMASKGLLDSDIVEVLIELYGSHEG